MLTTALRQPAGAAVLFEPSPNRSHREHRPMAAKTVTIILNQQQLELMDRMIAQGVAADRSVLVRKALREFAERREISGAKIDRNN
jgi:hypothetical protein